MLSGRYEDSKFLIYSYRVIKFWVGFIGVDCVFKDMLLLRSLFV